MSCNNSVAISAMTDVWNATGNYKVAIQMDVTDTSSASNSKLIDLLTNSITKFSVDKQGCIQTACTGIWLQDASNNGYGQNSSGLALYISNNSVLNIDSNSIFPVDSFSYDIGNTSHVFKNIYQTTNTNSSGTITEYPHSGSWGVHNNQSTDVRSIIFNNSSGVDTIEFGAKPISALDEGSLLTTNTSGFNFIGGGVTATLNGQQIDVTIPGVTGGGSGTPLEVRDEGSQLHADVTAIDFVGSGVTATNVGSVVTVTITGGSSGSSFTGITVDGTTITGDGSSNPLVAIQQTADGITITGDGVSNPFAADTGNYPFVTTVSVDGSTITGDGVANPLVALANSFTGVLTDSTITGNGLNTLLGITPLNTGSFISIVNTTLTISGNGVDNPIGIDFSSDSLNQASTGTDGKLYVPPESGNILSVYDEGSLLTNNVSSINFIGSSVTATTIGNDVTVTITGTGGGGGGGSGVLQVYDEGILLEPQATQMNFVGADVTIHTGVGGLVTVAVTGLSPFTGVLVDNTTITGDGINNPLVSVNSLQVSDEGSVLGNSITGIDFVGSGVVASVVGQNVTVRILSESEIPSFTSFSFNSSTPLEVGDTLSSGSYNFTWSSTNTGNITGNVVSIDDLTNSSSITGFTPNDDAETLNITGATRSTTGVHTYRISAVDILGNSLIRDYDVNFYNRIYYGESALTGLNESQVEALRLNVLVGNPDRTYSFTGGGYNYIAYPTGMGIRTLFLDVASDINVSMQDPNIVNLTNTFGISDDYYVYRTTNTLGSGIDIQIRESGSSSSSSTVSSAIETLDEGISLSSNTTSYNFVGDGVTATNVGNTITVTISGGSGNFTGVNIDNSLTGNGDSVNLGISFSNDANNIATTGSDGALYVASGGFDPLETHTFGVQQYSWTAMTTEAVVDLTGSSPSQTTTLTANRTLSFTGSMPANVDRVYYAEVTPGIYSLSLSSGNDPSSYFIQPSHSPFVVAFKVLSDGTPRFAGVI